MSVEKTICTLSSRHSQRIIIIGKCAQLPKKAASYKIRILVGTLPEEKHAITSKTICKVHIQRYTYSQLGDPVILPDTGFHTHAHVFCLSLSKRGHCTLHLWCPYYRILNRYQCKISTFVFVIFSSRTCSFSSTVSVSSKSTILWLTKKMKKEEVYIASGRDSTICTHSHECKPTHKSTHKHC